MKAEKIESAKYPLSGGYYTIERLGQDIPSKSDDVIVEAKILLPSNNTWLDENIRCDERCRIGRFQVGYSWGQPYTSNPKYRYITLQFSAKNWATAFREASICAEAELNKLETALADRAKALADAELE
jgi:hypothetical protein